MNNRPYPYDLTITPKDYNRAVDGLILEGFSLLSLRQVFATAESKTRDDPAAGKILWLLQQACSMTLRGSCIQTPLKPFSTDNQGRTSAIPEIFTPDELIFFSTVVEGVENYAIKARLADLLWLRHETRNIKYARVAIDAYTEYPLSPKDIFGCRSAWERAVRLCLQVRQGAENRLDTIRERLQKAFQTALFEDGSLPWVLSDLLLITNVLPEQHLAVTAKLEALAEAADRAKDLNMFRTYCESAIKWHKRDGRDADVYKLTVRIAESWVAQAELLEGHMVPASHYTSALELYKSIPASFRTGHRVNERIREISAQIEYHNKNSFSEMREFKSEPIDLSEQAKACENHIRGKTAPEALITFARIYPMCDAAEIEASAKEMTEQSILRSIIGATHLSKDGRVIAKSSGIDPHDADSPETRQVVWENMITAHQFQIQLVVKGFIWPSLCVILEDHRITEHLMLFLCQQSPLVPKNRASLWAKGLYYGFENKFTEAVHILPFQIEHWIRSELKLRNQKTTTVNAGVEMENALSTLLEQEMIPKIIGENLQFELKALLTDQLGSNFRNNIAHGLMEPDVAENSIHSVYFWWLCLKLVINTIPWKTPEK